MAKNPDISVIIPMYNSANYISLAISSIHSQDKHGLNFEIIVVDDMSTDDSREIVKKIQSDKIILIELKKNGGTAIARNEGLKVAKGTWIQFLDSDDKLSFDVFRKFSLSLKPDSNVYIFSLMSEFKDYNLIQTIDRVVDNRSLGHFGSACNKFIKRDICAAFKEEFAFEDVCFIIEMMNKPDLKASLIEDAYYIYNRKNEQSKMANFNKIEYNKMYNYVFDQIEHSNPLTKMFLLETYVGIVFSKGMPLSLSLPIAIRTLLKLYKYLPEVLINGIRGNVKNQKVIH